MIVNTIVSTRVGSVMEYHAGRYNPVCRGTGFRILEIGAFLASS